MFVYLLIVLISDIFRANYLGAVIGKLDEIVNIHSGRIELFVAGRWGTVCDDGFTTTNAHVACKQLGFGYASGWHKAGGSNSYALPTIADDVSCSGNEVLLSRLYATPLPTTNAALTILRRSICTCSLFRGHFNHVEVDSVLPTSIVTIVKMSC